MLFSIDDYRIQVSENATNHRSILRLHIESNTDQPFELTEFSINLRIPKDSFNGIWYPGSDVNSATMMAADPQHAFAAITDANFGIPFLGAVTSSGRNALAVGMGHQDLTVVMTGQPLDDGSYEFQTRVTTPRNAAAFDECFYLSNDPLRTWFETAANYTDWVDAYTNYKQFPISSRSYEPLYDSWYWSADQVNSDLYLKTAELSSAAGVRFFLADSGWDAPPGEWSKWLEGETGNYTPPANEFPDLADTFQSIRHDYGMAVQLWL